MDEVIDLLIKLSVCCDVDFINFDCRLLDQIGKKSELRFHNLTFMLEVAKTPWTPGETKPTKLGTIRGLSEDGHLFWFFEFYSLFV